MKLDIELCTTSTHQQTKYVNLNKNSFEGHHVKYWLQFEYEVLNFSQKEHLDLNVFET